MSPIATLFLAMSMSTDAFAAALGKGAALHRARLAEALRTGLVFGVTEAITPLIGWAVGRAAQGYMASIDHWIAFVLLGGIGAKMIWDGLKRSDEDEKPPRHSLAALLVTAIGTSIDAMAVGVTLALIGANILITAAAIGTATFAMTTLGMILGNALGARFGRHAEIAGGVVLIVIGCSILIEHTLVA